MSALAINPYENFMKPPRNTGSSQCSEHINLIYSKALDHYHEPVSRRIVDSLYAEVVGILEECRVRNWDGYGADPISPAAIRDAILFISSMPAWLPHPEIVAEPSGEIGFQWDFGKNRKFAASIKGNNTIIYAGLLGSGSKISGVEIYNDSIPKVISESIKRISD